MEFETVALCLAVAGIIFVLLEMSAPGGYMMIPGLDLLVLAFYVYFFPDQVNSWITIAVAVVFTIIVVVITLITYRYLGDTAPPSTTVMTSLIGRVGVVVIETNPDNLKGKVKIGSDIWSADSDEVIPKGTQVIVEDSEGVHVHVRKV